MRLLRMMARCDSSMRYVVSVAHRHAGMLRQFQHTNSAFIAILPPTMSRAGAADRE